MAIALLNSVYKRVAHAPLTLNLNLTPTPTPTLTKTLTITPTLTLNPNLSKVAHALTDLENHRTQRAHDNSLILKRFCFEAFDCYP